MKSLTEHLWFEVPNRRGFVNITRSVENLVRKSGVQEVLCLVNAMHITASVFINDAEAGLLQLCSWGCKNTMAAAKRFPIQTVGRVQQYFMSLWLPLGALRTAGQDIQIAPRFDPRRGCQDHGWMLAVGKFPKVNVPLFHSISFGRCRADRVARASSSLISAADMPP